MINRFFSRDSRSAIAAVFCATLLACEAPARPSSTASAEPDPGNPSTPHVVVMVPDNRTPLSSARTDAVAGENDPRPPPRSEKPRSRALLVTELQMLENLAAVTAPTDRDHPQVLRRIAEDCVELEYAARDEGNASLQITARNKAISAYARLVTDHPDYVQLDEALYYLAVEYEQAKDFEHARQTYLELIQKDPASRFIPNAYLAFGEMFFDEAAQDPSKWDLALSAYQRVLEDPPPQNSVYGYAWYKVAWVLRNKGDRDGARDAFNHAIEYATEYASAPGVAQLGEASKNDLRSL